MAAGNQDLGNGAGIIYLTNAAGNEIIQTADNTKQGVRNMRAIGSTLAPITVKQSARGTILVASIGSVGPLSAITIGGVNQIGAPVAFVIGNPTATAGLIAAAINSHTPISGPKYYAENVGNKTYIIAPLDTGAAANGIVITLTYTGANTLVAQDFINGADVEATIIAAHDRKFFLNANYGGTAAPDITGLVNAIDVSKFLVVRGSNVGMDTQEIIIVNDALPAIDRRTFYTTLVVDTQGAIALDKLVYLPTDGFEVGDIIFMRSKTSARVISVESAPVSALTNPVKNIYLTNDNAFATTGFNALFLQYRYDPLIGPYWAEMMRSVGDPNTDFEVTRAQAVSLRGANNLIKGKRYWVYNVADGIGLGPGYGGIILQAVATNAFAQEGVFMARCVNRDNVTARFDTAEVVAIGQRREWLNEIYEKTTGVNTGLAPSDDLTNWDFIPKDDSDYFTEVQSCIYSFSVGVIKARWDARNNRIENTGNRPANELMLQAFRFGTDDVTNNYHVYESINNGFAPGTRTPVDINIFNLSLMGEMRNNLSKGTIFNETGLKAKTSAWSDNTYAGCFVSLLGDWTLISGNVHVGGLYQYDAGYFIAGCTFTSCSFNNNTATLSMTSCILFNAVIDSNVHLEFSNNANGANSALNITTNDHCLMYNNEFKGAANTVSNNTYSYINNGVYQDALVQNNIGDSAHVMSIYGNSVKTGSISDNDCSGCIYYNGGFIQNNTLNQSDITNIVFLQTGGGGVTMGIFNCVMNNAIITRLTINANPGAISIPGNTAAVYRYEGFVLDGIYIDGEGGTTFPYASPVNSTRYALSTTSGALTGHSGSSKGTDFYGFLNMADAAVFSAGVITIPAGMQHISRFYLYGTTSQNVTEIVNLGVEVGTIDAVKRNNRHFSRFFSVWDGTGANFVPTAKAIATTTQIVSDAATTIALLGPGDWIEIRRSALKAADANTYLVKQLAFVAV